MAPQDKNPPPHEDDDFFEEWFPPNGEVDPELTKLPRPQVNMFRPVMMLAIIGLTAFVGVRLGLQEQLDFLFTNGEEPLDLGDVTEYPRIAKENPEKLPKIPHNRMIAVRGIPEVDRTSVSCTPYPTRYYKLIGAHVYIEEPLDISPLECRAQYLGKGKEIPEVSFFDGTGRAVELGRDDKYHKLTLFYEKVSGDLFCSALSEPKREGRVKFLRRMLREKHKVQNGSYPSDEEVEAMLNRETLCYDGYIIQTSVTPLDYWYHLAILGALGLIILWNILALLLWIRKFIRAQSDTSNV